LAPPEVRSGEARPLGRPDPADTVSPAVRLRYPWALLYRLPRPGQNLLGERGRGYAQFLRILGEGRVCPS